MANERKMSLSLGRECTAYGCSSRDYYFENTELLSFPSEPSRKKLWCNLVKRQDGMDGLKITKKSTQLCEKHFESHMVYRPPGGTKKRLLADSKPTLHGWNNCSLPSRKKPTYRSSPRKK